MDPGQLRATRPGRRHGHLRRARVSLIVLTGLLAIYLLAAYELAPAWWRHHTRGAPGGEAQRVTRTIDGIDGDPLNVALVGTRVEVVQAMLAAGWHPADRTTLRTSLRICKSVVRNQAYDTAPVSNLYVWGRRQDLAFQRAAGTSPKRRHHVRFWQSDEVTADGRPLWVGAATFDRSVGFSYRTWQVTHHIATDVDAERDRLADDLKRGGQLATVYQLAGAAPAQGRNGGGDRYHSDGNRTVGVIATNPDRMASLP